MEGSFQLEEFPRKLLQDGVITVSVHMTQTGVEAYAYSVAAHPSRNVWPHVSLELSELSDIFAGYEGRTNCGVPGDLSRGSPEHHTVSEFTTVGQIPIPLQEKMSVPYARGVINNRLGGGYVVRRGVKNLLPKDSLTVEDLNASNEVLYARMVIVANAIGNVKAVARIACSKDLKVDGVHTIAGWWNQATFKQRLTLLTKAKALTVDDALSKLSEDRIARFADCELRSPFRGSPIVLESVEEDAQSVDFSGN